MTNRKMTRIAVFASGNGSNAQRIAEYFSGNPVVSVALIISNKKDAYVLERARILDIPYYYIPKSKFAEREEVVNLLRKNRIDFIVLAGFLLLVPPELIDAFPKRIINIHPALLPKYGGQGMFGRHVHEAVLAAGEKESGITIHFVNEKYDDGEYIFQARCDVLPDDTPDILAQRIHVLEHEYFPKVIERLLLTE